MILETRVMLSRLSVPRQLIEALSWDSAGGRVPQEKLVSDHRLRSVHLKLGPIGPIKMDVLQQHLL